MTTRNHLTEQEFKEYLELLENENLDAENLKNLADDFFYSGKYGESIRACERILEKESDLEIINGAKSRIAMSYFKKEDYKESLQYFNEILETESENVVYLSYKFMSLEKLGDFASAVKCGDKIIRIRPNASVLLKLIDIAFELEEFEKCIHYIDFLKTEPTIGWFKKQILNIDCNCLKIKKMECLLNIGKYEECIKESRKVKKDAHAYRVIGRAYAKLTKNVKAIRYMIKSFEMSGNIDVLLEIADMDNVRPEYYLNWVLEIEPQNEKALLKIAEACMDKGDYALSKTYAEELLEINPDIIEAYIIISDVNLYSEDFANAERIVDRGLSRFPDSSKLWTQKACIYYSSDLNRYEEYTNKAIDLDPTNQDLYLKLIEMLWFEKELERAEKYFDELLIVDPAFPMTFEELINSFEKFYH